MTWNRLGVFNVSPQWQFSEPVEGEFFRIKNTLSAPTPSLWSGLICQSQSGFNQPLIYEAERIWAVQDEWTAFRLIKPEFLPNRSIGVKRLGNIRTSINWQLILEVWKPQNSLDSNFPSLTFPP